MLLFLKLLLKCLESSKPVMLNLRKIRDCLSRTGSNPSYLECLCFINTNEVRFLFKVTSKTCSPPPHAHHCIFLTLVLQVNGQNVVKVGHRQVVNMIRQGGNSLMVKVVMVARNPELEETARKKGKSNFPPRVISILCLWGVSKADCMFTSL